jgi:hypothetical protein
MVMFGAANVLIDFRAQSNYPLRAFLAGATTTMPEEEDAAPLLMVNALLMFLSIFELNQTILYEPS